MAQDLKIWFDSEGDFLEVLFSDKPGLHARDLKRRHSWNALTTKATFWASPS